MSTASPVHCKPVDSGVWSEASNFMCWDWISHDKGTDSIYRKRLSYASWRKCSFSTMWPRLKCHNTDDNVNAKARLFDWQMCMLTPSDYHFWNQNVLEGAILFFWNQYSNIVRKKLSGDRLIDIWESRWLIRHFSFLMILASIILFLSDFPHYHVYKLI